MTASKGYMSPVAELSPPGCNATGEVFLCAPGECVALSLRCNGVTECSAGQDESVRECGCLPNEFECKDSCIDETRRCDTFRDCPDGADELNCDTYVCPATFFKCNNHFCVPSELVCDFDDHCGDGSDEQLCHHRKCWKAEFECDNGQCIRPGRVCDGVTHCKDGTDEDRCTPEDFAVCGSGSRVHRFYWCDGWPDCADNHADELNCGSCEAGQGFHRCPNSRCILQSNVCDVFCDCVPDCSDETACPASLYTRQDGVARCEAEVTLTCLVASQERARDRCIASQYICDGSSDCHNGQYYNDEFGCVGGGEAGSRCPGEEAGGEVSGRWFLCEDGRCIPSSLRCDYKNDCLHGDDEDDCETPVCGPGEWRCQSGQCVPAVARCDLLYSCLDKTDEIGCEGEPCGAGYWRCGGGQCVESRLWCDWVKDCPDGSDEVDCGDARGECGPGEFRCSSGQCIERRYRCDASVGERQGCADSSHLLNCSMFECGPGVLKCASGPCLGLGQVCDGFVDCPLTWDDEDNCPFVCSASAPSCECRDISINCEGRELKSVPKDIELQISRFHLSGNDLEDSLSAETFVLYSHLAYLDISNNSLTVLPVGLFLGLNRLRILDLRDNLLTCFQNSTFLGLVNLRTLHVTGNRVATLEGWSLYGLSSLSSLDLSGQRVSNVSTHAFLGLRSLLSLNLSHNHLSGLEDGSLTGLAKLLSLDLRGNMISVMDPRVFSVLPRLLHLWTDEFRFCCLARHVPSCYPRPDQFSSCEDLMTNGVLRVCVWVLASLALSGNLLVILWRLVYSSDNQVHSFLITNLALGDLCMGLYLLIIAAVDMRYRGVYFIYDAVWRTSPLCQLAGFLSTFSSELSVFTLTVITLERFLVIMFPFRVPRLTMGWTRAIMGGVWACVGLLSALPLAPLTYFKNFYGRSGVCLALHITHEKPSGWEYSVFVFLVVNLVSFSVIAGSYCGMYRAARTSSAAVRSDQQVRESSMARKMMLIVVTDAACWLPIILLGLLSLAGVIIPPQVFAWVAVFILPLNAAVNPLLYTLSTAPFLGKARERVLDVRHSFKRSMLRHTASPSTAEMSTGEAALMVCHSDITAPTRLLFPDATRRLYHHHHHHLHYHLHHHHLHRSRSRRCPPTQAFVRSCEDLRSHTSKKCARGSGDTCACSGKESSCIDEEACNGGEHRCGQRCSGGRGYSSGYSGVQGQSALLVQRELIPLNVLSPPRQPAPRRLSRKSSSSFTASARRRQDLYD
ncbi:LOW QUALITY PROTEIN: G-protein coupled receptor GRL101-like [Portunus trituberculatus]|uniref:LOW QUALITY PROTEIN: G-protein coupled receptor GRL101-like n=1 Tax=Portunus trituberculatus TaxID=210409 RepID=UPI001E1D209B|nr:LOW QUALITY PROTEIN: G-protein coupled receptor GRL101-like [Portunus trituberculatus]